MDEINSERLSFDLGWDISRLGYSVLPGTRVDASVTKGMAAGRAHFGAVPGLACRYERKIIQTRMSACRRNIGFDVQHVTADFLRQIDVEFCPITRDRLTHSTGYGSDWSVDRIDNSFGYVPGNLVIMSTLANKQKSALDITGLGQRAVDHTLQPSVDCEMAAEAWQRLWTLASFANNASSDAINAWPMVVLPPNWVPMVLAWETKRCVSFVAEYAVSDRCKRDLLDGKKEVKAVEAFAEAKHYANRRANKALMAAHPINTRDVVRWTMEDAWREPLVNNTYCKVAKTLSEASQLRLIKYFRHTSCAPA